MRALAKQPCECCYAGAAVADPDIRPIYLQMALENGKNPGRPFNMAVSDYCNNGNNLL